MNKENSTIMKNRRFVRFNLIIIAILLLANCGDPIPVEDMANAKLAIAKAESVLADKYAKDKYMAAKKALLASHKQVTEKEIIAQIGQRLKQIRLQHNLTQKELSIDTGLSVSTISLIEQGNSTSIESLIRILVRLNRVKDLESVFRVGQNLELKLNKYPINATNQ